jgi:hypothetical protein
MYNCAVAMKPIERIWYDDPLSFVLDGSKATHFIPDQYMSLNEQLNACFRFSVYFSFIVWLVRQDARVFFFAIFVGLLTIIIHKFDANSLNEKNTILEKLELSDDRVRGVCVKPTLDNPFMNVGFADYKDFPNRPQACNVMKKPVKQMIKQYFDTNLNRADDDIFHKGSSDRQFYTMPITTIPNDQQSFAEWCFKPRKTCKEDVRRCL